MAVVVEVDRPRLNEIHINSYPRNANNTNTYTQVMANGGTLNFDTLGPVTTVIRLAEIQAGGSVQHWWWR